MPQELDLTLSFVFHNSKSSFSFLHEENIRSSGFITYYLAEDRDGAIGFGLGNGITLIATKSELGIKGNIEGDAKNHRMEIKFILNATGSPIVSLFRARNQSYGDLYISVAKDGYFFCFSATDGHCIHKEQIDNQVELSQQNCAMIRERFLIVSWKGKVGAVIIDIENDFRIYDCLPEIVHGAKYIYTSRSNATPGHQDYEHDKLTCIDEADTLHEFYLQHSMFNAGPARFESGGIRQSTFGLKLFRFDASLKLTEQQLRDIEVSRKPNFQIARQTLVDIVSQYDEMEKNQSVNFLFLTPGNVLVFIKDGKISCSLFPREGTIKRDNESTIELFDPGWDMIDPSLTKLKMYENVLSENVILAIDRMNMSLCATLVRVPLRKRRISNPPIAEDRFSMPPSPQMPFIISSEGTEDPKSMVTIIPWTKLFSHHIPPNEPYKIFPCSNIKSRKLRASNNLTEISETRVLFAILAHHQLLVFAFKRSLRLRPAKMDCAVEWDWNLLHRFHIKPLSSVHPDTADLYWDVNKYVIHMPLVATWCLKTGISLRTYSDLDEQGVYIREVHTTLSQQEPKRNVLRKFGTNIAQLQRRRKVNSERVKLKKSEKLKSAVNAEPQRLTHHNTVNTPLLENSSAMNLEREDSFASSGSGKKLANRFKAFSLSRRATSTRGKTTSTENTMPTTAPVPASEVTVTSMTKNDSGYQGDYETHDEATTTDGEFEFKDHNNPHSPTMSAYPSMHSIPKDFVHESDQPPVTNVLKSLGVKSSRLKNGDLILHIDIRQVLMEFEQDSCDSAGRICGGALALLHAWGVQETDDDIIRVLKIRPPSLHYSLVTGYLFGEHQLNETRHLSSFAFEDLNSNREVFAYSCGLEPRMDHLVRFQVSSTFTTEQVLSLVAILLTISNKIPSLHDAEPLLAKLVTHYVQEYPWKNFRHSPDLTLLSEYLLDSECVSLFEAAKLMLECTFQGLEDSVARSILDDMLRRGNELNSSENLFMLLLAVNRFGSSSDIENGKLALTENKCGMVTKLLVQQFQAPNGYLNKAAVVIAAESLTKGIRMFRKELLLQGSMVAVINTLLCTYGSIDPEITAGSNQGNIRDVSLAESCEKAFLCIASEMTLELLEIMNRLVQQFNVSLGPNRSGLVQIKSALNVLVLLISQTPGTFIAYLPVIMDIVLNSLDPSEPTIRKACLRSGTKLLHQMVKQLPMVDFHQQTQRLAVGTQDDYIVIYDLKTAAKWRVLEGHKNALSALCFQASSGEKLASYSAKDGVLKVWNLNSGGLFGAFLSVKGKCTRTYNIPTPSEPNDDFKSPIPHAKISWAHQTIILERDSQQIFTVSTK